VLYVGENEYGYRRWRLRHRVLEQGVQELLMLRGIVCMASFGLLLLISTGSGQGQPHGKQVETKLPKDLLGKWVVVEGPLKGAAFEFFPDGKMLAKLNIEGKELIINATVRVENKQLLSTTKNPQSGKEDTRVLPIRTMTSTEFVVEDDQGKLIKMQRPAEPLRPPKEHPYA
jgi:uncharacterized protein (TIGR03066 family)